MYRVSYKTQLKFVQKATTWVLCWQQRDNVVFCCCSSSTSRVHMLCILRCFSAHHTFKEWLPEIQWPLPVRPFFPDLSHHHGVSASGCFLFFLTIEGNPRGCENPRRAAVTANTPNSLAPTIISWSKSLRQSVPDFRCCTWFADWISALIRKCSYRHMVSMCASELFSHWNA